jgi:hypothetical protein
MLLRDRLHLPLVTLICVAGVKPFGAIRALLISMFKVRFPFVILVTPKKNWFRWLIIFGIMVEAPYESNLDSMDEYNRYIVFKLYRHITTSHCLLIQADGYIQSPKSWKEEFLKYDYVGAPWPIAIESYITPFDEQVRVGNGGFSLRSSKLLQVPLNHPVNFDVNQGDFYKHFGKKYTSEDGVICVHNRHIYVDAGCKFAPLEIAAQFSRETKIEGITPSRTFGFHRYK